MPVCAFIVGAAVMAVEITASRLLAPYFGTSIFVWTSLIVTVLLAMSLGYWLGGLVAEKNGGKRALGILLCSSAAVMLVGTFSLGLFAHSLSWLVNKWSVASATLFFGSLLSSFVVFALPVMLAAAASPIIIKEWLRDGGDSGRVSARYLVVSTFGSVVGTIAPTLLLVPTIGTKRTVALFAVAMFLMGLSMFAGKKRGLFVVLFLPTLGLSLLDVRPASPDILAQKESPYQLISVAEREGERLLYFNEGTGVQTIYRPGGGRTDFYFDYFSILPFIKPRQREQKVLMLGVAGGSLIRSYQELLPADEHADITGVEIDPAVIEVGREYFDLDDLRMKIVNADARVFISATPEKYDFIIIDAYSNQLYIPPHLITKEFFALAKSKLNPDGFLVMNVNAPDEESRLLKATVNSVASSFPEVYVLPVAGDTWNHLIFAGDQAPDFRSAEAALPPSYGDVSLALKDAYRSQYDPKAEVFTDDLAPVEMLTDSMFIAQGLKRW